MTARRVGAVGCVAVTVGAFAVWLAAPAQAITKWSSARNLTTAEVTSIDTDGRGRLALQVRSDAAGNSIAAWQQHDNGSCQAVWAVRPFGGSWSAPKPLAAAGACLTSDLALAMNKTGAAVVAFVDSAGVVAALRPPGGSFGTATTMSAVAFAAYPAVSINETGTVAVAWVEESFTIGSPSPLKARIRPTGGTFTAVEPLTSTGAAFAPSLAVGPNGQVTAAWARTVSDLQSGQTTFSIQTAYRPVGGHFPTTPNQTLDSWTAFIGSPVEAAPDLALDATGRVSAVWLTETAGKRVVRTAAKIATASQFGTVQTVNASDTGNSRFPRVAIDSATNLAVAVWFECASSCTVHSAVRPSGGGFGSLQTISGALPTVGLYAPAVGFTSGGMAVAAWSGPPGGTGPDGVASARRPKGGSFGASAFLSGPVGSVDETGPALGFDGHGNAVAVWAQVSSVPSARVRFADLLASWYQPDGRIKKASATTYLGANVFNTTGTQQLVSQNVLRGHSVTFDIKMVNHSSVIDTIAVKAPGDKTGFTVKYLAGTSGTTSITTSIVNGTYAPKLAPGAGKTFRLVVTAKSGAIVGTANFWSVTATSRHDTTRKDVVKASVTISG